MASQERRVDEDLKLEGAFHPNWYPAILFFERDGGLNAADHAQIDKTVAALKVSGQPAAINMVVHEAILTQEVTDGPNAGKAAQVIVPFPLIWATTAGTSSRTPSRR